MGESSLQLLREMFEADKKIAERLLATQDQLLAAKDLLLVAHQDMVLLLNNMDVMRLKGHFDQRGIYGVLSMVSVSREPRWALKFRCIPLP